MHFAWNEKKKRKQEWESHKIALDVMKESKGKHPKQPSRDEGENHVFPDSPKYGKNEDM